MIFIEDFFEEPETDTETHYKTDGKDVYKNTYSVPLRGHVAPAPGGTPAAAPAPKAPAGGPPRQYSPDLKIHQKAGEYTGENKRGVEYTTLRDRIMKYKVTVAGKMTRGVPAETMDTPALKQQAVQQFGEAQIGNATLEEDASQAALADEWAVKALIWVCVPIDASDVKQSVFYSHVCRPGAFHHSSLAAGREVCGAGEWIIESGKLRKISANSGHYQPSLTALYQSVLALAPAWQEDTTVLLWNKTSHLWEDVPVKDFAKDGGAGYKSHPRAG